MPRPSRRSVLGGVAACALSAWLGGLPVAPLARGRRLYGGRLRLGVESAEALQRQLERCLHEPWLASSGSGSAGALVQRVEQAARASEWSWPLRNAVSHDGTPLSDSKPGSPPAWLQWLSWTIRAGQLRMTSSHEVPTSLAEALLELPVLAPRGHMDQAGFGPFRAHIASSREAVLSPFVEHILGRPYLDRLSITVGVPEELLQYGAVDLTRRPSRTPVPYRWASPVAQTSWALVWRRPEPAPAWFARIDGAALVALAPIDSFPADQVGAPPELPAGTKSLADIQLGWGDESSESASIGAALAAGVRDWLAAQPQYGSRVRLGRAAGAHAELLRLRWPSADPHVRAVYAAHELALSESARADIRAAAGGVQAWQVLQSVAPIRLLVDERPAVYSRVDVSELAFHADGTLRFDSAWQTLPAAG